MSGSEEDTTLKEKTKRAVRASRGLGFSRRTFFSTLVRNLNLWYGCPLVCLFFHHTKKSGMLALGLFYV